MPIIVYPPGMEWQTMQQRPHHLLKQAASHGWEVFFGETSPTPTAPYQVRPHLYVVGDWEQLPLQQWDVLYLTDPQKVLFCRKLRARMLVYDCVDERGAADEKLLRHADLVLATSRLLAEKARQAGARHVLYLPNACDYEHFAVAGWPKADAAPTIGYCGVLAPHLDYELLFQLILRVPNWHWCFIGQEKGRVYLPATARVERLGHQDYEALPRLLETVHVGIIPFTPSALTRAVNPVKVYEYLAAARPVVAPALPELLPLAEQGLLTCCASDWRAWREALECALEAGPNRPGQPRGQHVA